MRLVPSHFILFDVACFTIHYKLWTVAHRDEISRLRDYLQRLVCLSVCVVTRQLHVNVSTSTGMDDQQQLTDQTYTAVVQLICLLR